VLSEQVILEDLTADLSKLHALAAIEPQLLMVFGCVTHFSDPALELALSNLFPDAYRVGCSTAGEISNNGVGDNTTVVTAIRFENAKLHIATVAPTEMNSPSKAGKALAQNLKVFEPDGVMMFGLGVDINSSEMVLEGLASELGPSIPVTGGLGGDNGAFQKTYTLCNEGISSSRVVSLGLKGAGFKFSHGCNGGWQPFGPTRKVTRCEQNILYELDGEPALDLCKRYLNEHARDLPLSALQFPFEMLNDPKDTSHLIRTTMSINENDGSLIMAGMIRPGSYLRLMHAHTDYLVDGAEAAALEAIKTSDAPPLNGVAILISCVGRKLVMENRTDEEIDQVRQVLGGNVTVCGFYSQGEISNSQGLLNCQLHNQTMTITYLTEF